MRPLSALAFGALLAVVLNGCGKAPADKDKVYDIKGKVVSLDATNNRIVLDHEDIPGLMPKMKMPFDVQDAKLLKALKPGDPVEGRLQAKDGAYTIIELRTR